MTHYTKEYLVPIIDRLYINRNIEITNLWQRSVFLGTFLVLCFTGYGAFLMSYIDKANEKDKVELENTNSYENRYCMCNMDRDTTHCTRNSDFTHCVNNGVAFHQSGEHNNINVFSNKETNPSSKNEFSSERFYLLNIIGFGIGCISLIFSVLWILMAKGSKAWYEVYETAICRLEIIYYSVDENADEQIETSEQKIKKEMVMGEFGLPPKKRNNSIFSSKAGAYSPSKINIAIGQISFTIWVIVVLIHGYLLLNHLVILLIIIIIFVFVNIYVFLNLKSGHLNQNYNEEGQLKNK